MKILIFIITIFLINLAGFGQTATFSSNFEDQNFDAEIGTAEFEKGTSGGWYIVPNPSKDTRNSSDYVLKVYTNPGTGGRAEYKVVRHETNEKTYIYRWKRFFPVGIFTDMNNPTFLQNQWKTWPCYDNVCHSGSGIFNDLSLEPDMTAEHRLSAYPNCKYDYIDGQAGLWQEYTLEMYWTQTDNGYYRLWKNDTLYGYSNNMKTLTDNFTEGECDIFWTVGIYGGWTKGGDKTQDSLIAYLDDLALYDLDNGFTITDICPDCEFVPPVPTDSNVYKVNTHFSAGAPDGYANFIVDWEGDTSNINLVNTFGQNYGIDLYLWSGTSPTSNNLFDDCFPDDVIQTAMLSSDAETHQIYLKDLNPGRTYSIKVLSAGGSSGKGLQIWTTEANRDTVFSSGNTCDIAELKNLVPDGNGDLAINLKSTTDFYPRVYINAIEIVEYVVNNITYNKTNSFNKLIIFPNPINDNLFVNSEIVPSNITIYSCDGRKVKYAENTNIVNFSDLKKGIYIVLVNIQQSFTTIKIIKE